MKIRMENEKPGLTSCGINIPVGVHIYDKSRFPANLSGDEILKRLIAKGVKADVISDNKKEELPEMTKDDPAVISAPKRGRGRK
jgi:hypothetical protein